MKRTALIPFTVATVIFMLIPLSLIIVFVHPFHRVGKPLVVDSYRDPNDGFILLIQSFNGSIGEPYTVTAYQQQSGGNWIWYYIDHESTYWWSGKVLKKDGKYQIYRGSALVAEVDPVKQQIRQVNDNFVREGQQRADPFLKEENR